MKNLPTAIIVGAVIIAGAIFIVNRPATDESPVNEQKEQADQQTQFEFRLIGEDDHLRGNPDAKLIIVEYSDYQCTFCSKIHPTLKKLIEDRPNDVNWVYRHFPLTSIHPQAALSAVASECVAKLADNESFWQFSDYLLENQTKLNINLYRNKAVELGIEQTEFESCLNSGEVKQAVEDDLNEGVAIGVRATPTQVIVTESGDRIILESAVSYDSLSSAIDQILTNSN